MPAHPAAPHPGRQLARVQAPPLKIARTRKTPRNVVASNWYVFRHYAFWNNVPRYPKPRREGAVLRGFCPTTEAVVQSISANVQVARRIGGEPRLGAEGTIAGGVTHGNNLACISAPKYSCACELLLPKTP